ncbi:MAG: ATP-binding protein [Christensenella sp.]
MQRHLQDQLVAWKNKPNRKPLIINGARQVGKTWLMKNFGREHFAKVAYINFDNNTRMQQLFEEDYNLKRILKGLQIEAGVSLTPENTLIIFDEIQAAPKALASLKYFNEDASEYAVIAAGSLLGTLLHQNVSYPVGKTESINLYPLSFTEYLQATDNGALLDLLKSKDWETIATFSSRYIQLLKEYYFVGGMPAAVLAYLENHDFATVRAVQTNILNDYDRDFSKHTENPTESLRVSKVWDSLPAQLGREKRKFIYGKIEKGGRAKSFEMALQWLVKSGLTYEVPCITKPGLPLKSYEDLGVFKLFALDVGLLGAMSGLDATTLLEGNAIFEEFKGSLTEQYACQQLISDCALTPYYWSAENSSGELDFVVSRVNEIVALEVKAEENLQAKSLKSFYNTYPNTSAIRSSLSNYRKQDWMTNIPLYALSTLKTP